MRTKAAHPITKQKLLDAAQELMLAKGFVATSLDEICKKAKVTKGSFFHYFKSKDELAKVLLERYCCSSRKLMQEGCCCGKKTGDPLTRVYGHIDFAIELSKKLALNKGCLIGAFAQELSDTHPHVRSLCAEGFNEWAKILKEDFAEAKAKYAPRASFDPKELADHFIAVLEGSQILAKAKQDKMVVAKNMQHFRRYIQGLFKK